MEQKGNPVEPAEDRNDRYPFDREENGGEKQSTMYAVYMYTQFNYQLIAL